MSTRVEFADRVEWLDDQGLYHREDGPAIETEYGKSWYFHGAQHRGDGPAIELDSGTKYWYNCGKCHRFDGPALEVFDGTFEFWLYGKHITKEQFQSSRHRFIELTEETINA